MSDPTESTEVVLYPEESINAETGTIQVTPELIAQLIEDVIRRGDREHTQGDLRLRVDYDDLKALLTASGKQIREITRHRAVEL